jgi:hypothetical protein
MNNKFEAKGSTVEEEHDNTWKEPNNDEKLNPNVVKESKEDEAQKKVIIN